MSALKHLTSPHNPISPCARTAPDGPSRGQLAIGTEAQRLAIQKGVTGAAHGTDVEKDVMA